MGKRIAQGGAVPMKLSQFAVRNSLCFTRMVAVTSGCATVGCMGTFPLLPIMVASNISQREQ